jgi:hypothetical protein
MKESRKEDNIEDDSLKDTMSLHLDGLVKSDPKELSSNKDGDSIKKSIEAVRARLFKGSTQDSAELEEELESTAKSDNKKKSKQTSWVHVPKAGATPAAAKAKQGMVFAEGTQFNNKPSKPAKKTPSKTDVSNLFTSVTRIKIKLFHGVPEVQTAIMALLDYCLTTLQERDKLTTLRKGISTQDFSATQKRRKRLRQRTFHRTLWTFMMSGVSGTSKRGPS